MLPIKKRKVSAPLAVKVDRLAKAVSRQRPDRQQAMISTAFSTTVNGFNEQLVDCLPADLVQNVAGDFVVERIEFRVSVDTAGSLSRGRVDVIVPQESNQITTTGAIAANAFFADKEYKSYASKPLYPNAASPYVICQGAARLGLVVKKQNNIVTRNNPYLVLRYQTTGVSAVGLKVFVRITYREK